MGRRSELTARRQFPRPFDVAVGVIVVFTAGSGDA
jgi:hypothetical protein